MYHMLIKRQIIRLSNDIDNIKMCKRILQETKKLKKSFVFLKCFGQRYFT